ncbi:MAG: VCBS repeat-containing protein [Phycisphaeraceae bacterium]|nr:MAG: VCBS repeat-containing protein [Phycisphaeraceae bacterium]
MDLNGDGHVDVISGRYSPGVVTFFAGSTSGFKKGAPIEEIGVDHNEMRTWMACANFADLDGDGDLDMVVGNVSGDVFYNLNTGDAKKPKFGLRRPLMLSTGKPVKVNHKSDPLPVDWDGDGVLDLVVGDEWAGVTFFRGTGQRDGDGLPTFEPGVPIVPGKEKNLVPGFRVRVETADWNNDGKLDLLVGNCEQVGDKLIGNVYVFLRK